MKLSVVASGSKGNCTYIESNNKKILIDAGISKKRLFSFFEKNGIEPDISGILITHEHVDHTSGLKAFLNGLKCPLYITKGTYDALYYKMNDVFDNTDINIITNQSIFDIGDLHIHTMPTFHDAQDPVGFIIESDNKKIVYITDTGYVHSSFYTLISNASIYVLETNHDPEMLMHCDRPYNLKLRILGDHGHMSNEDALYLLSHIMGDNTKYVFYAHISDECNLWNIIEVEALKMFDKLGIDTSGVEFIFTSQIPSKVINI